MFVVVVHFQLKPGAAGRFMPLVIENARVTMEREPACRQFDVCVADGSDEKVLLYEIYLSQEAFQAHLKMPHFVKFDSDVKDLVAGKVVNTYRRSQA